MKNAKTATAQKTNVQPFVVLEGQTDKGKKCLLIKTSLRLNGEDFKKLFRDIRTTENGFPFMKYFPEHEGRFITVTGVDAVTLTALASQYVWTAPVAKEKKAKATKVAKNPVESDNTQNTISGFTPEQIAEAIALLGKLKK